VLLRWLGLGGLRRSVDLVFGHFPRRRRRGWRWSRCGSRLAGRRWCFSRSGCRKARLLRRGCWCGWLRRLRKRYRNADLFLVAGGFGHSYGGQQPQGAQET
jgi:hypothetical protein